LGVWRQHLRFALGFPAYARERITPEQARTEVRRRLEGREEHLRSWVRRVVFELGKTPYAALFRWAGCEAGDFDRLVRGEGVEGALEELRRAGVWVAYEEFKGRRPIVRGGQRLETRPGDFDNPLLGGSFAASSGGTTGPGTRVMIDLGYLRSRAVNHLVADAAKGYLGMPAASWSGVLPDVGLTSMLTKLRYDGMPERWFSPVSFDDTRAPLSMRLAHHYTTAVARALGARVPRAEVVPIEEAGRIAEWLHERGRAGGRVLLRAPVSRLVKVAAAARAGGRDLSHAVLCGGGEPPTEAKVAEIRRSGAAFDTGYAFTEAGPVGTGCTRPVGPNDVHLYEDRIALIQHQRTVADTSVPAFLFTSLLDVAPKLLLNVESDDYGVVERRSCGCPLEREGFGRHVRDIRSFSKLTGGGMTLIGSEALRLLEEVLPARFDASALDFQLQEREVGGETRICLVASPRVSASDEQIAEAFRDGLRDGTPAASLAAAVWAQSHALRVVREEPRWTRRGKLLPLDLAVRGVGDDQGTRGGAGARDHGASS
jgi:hypothetical protein